MNKSFKGDAIYNPSGKAGEYSYWACNFYKGCSGNCTYCYLKKGVLGKTLGGNKPELKSCFKDSEHAIQVFQKEVTMNCEELRKHGLFFTFTSDPFLPETNNLTMQALHLCYKNRIPAKLLTKQTDWVEDMIDRLSGTVDYKNILAIGFTLTGHDELEPGCSSNAERIQAMKDLHDAGFITWSSIEPIIDFDSSFEMIKAVKNCCDLFKIGLLSGKKYDKIEVLNFIARIETSYNFYYKAKWYFKDSLLKTAGINRVDLPTVCVNADYNLFNPPSSTSLNCPTSPTKL